jgi:type IV pilus assembly protein PilC
MPSYQYTATNMSGQKVSGMFEAASEESVRYMLRQKSYYPLEIHPISARRNLGEIELFPRIAIKQLSILCKQLSAVLRAGVPLMQALSIMVDQTEEKKLKKSLQQIYEDVQTGQSLSASLRAQGQRYPAMMISMVEAGEVSGTLDSSLERLGENFEREAVLSAKLRNAMIYPAMVALVAIAVVIYLLNNVVPVFTGIFESAGSALPAPTRLLMALSDFVRQNFMIVLLSLVVLVVLFRVVIHSPAGRLAFDRMKLRAPIVGKLNTKVVAARFTRTLATLSAAGVSLTQAIEITADAVSNKFVRAALLEVSTLIKQGEGLSRPLADLDIFPPMVVHMTRLGEESGTLDDLLTKSAVFFDQESEAAVQRMTSLMEPLIIVVLGGIIVFIVISILLPMFGMYSMI